MEQIRKHLYEEGSVAKSELVKLIKDVTQVMSKLKVSPLKASRIGTKCYAT